MYQYHHRLTMFIGSSAAVLAIVIHVGVPFVRMLPLLLVLTVPLIVLVALRVVGDPEAAANGDEADAATVQRRRPELQRH